MAVSDLQAARTRDAIQSALCLSCCHLLFSFFCAFAFLLYFVSGSLMYSGFLMALPMQMPLV